MVGLSEHANTFTSEEDETNSFRATGLVPRTIRFLFVRVPVGEGRGGEGRGGEMKGMNQLLRQYVFQAMRLRGIPPPPLLPPVAASIW